MRVPIKWNHLIGNDSLKIKELEDVSNEKGEQLFLVPCCWRSFC
jgi:hypothetical protein